jgi:pyrroloquinoline quinone (PQQ) biosynthesis protein C
MTFFERLMKDTAAERQYLLDTPQIKDGLVGHISLSAYLAYLTQAYHHVSHTVPLMQRTKELLSERQKWMVPALDEYIAEESGHEQWILDDIAAAGGDAETVRNSAPDMGTEFMVSYAYDYVSRINPVGFFGMVLVLEGTSTQLATAAASAIRASLDLPESCFHYLTSHGSLDIQHMKFFENLMNQISDDADKNAVVHMARRIYVLFANMFRAIPHQVEMPDAA